MTMRILLAPDSFKGTFTAIEVADALARGVESAGAEADRCPVADGGEGTMRAVLAVLGGEEVEAPAHDPLGRAITARWGRLGEDGSLAIVECAQASGLTLVAEDERDAWAAGTAGTGELIVAAVASGASEVLVAVGGSATTDGGRGALEAIEAAGGIGDARLTVLCDVTTAWERCASVFGPQKGADAAMVARLEERLDAYAETLPRDPRGVPMTGGAGGLSGGLWAGLGADLVPGAARVLDLIGFDERLSGALAVVAGEGGLDFQSLEGKIVGEVARRAHAANVPVHAVVGTSKLADGDRDALSLASVVEAPTLAEIEAAGGAVVERTRHRAAMLAALALEAEGQRALLDGRPADGRACLARAAERWWESWELAPPGAVGRLVGMIKAAIVSRSHVERAAERIRDALGGPASPTSGYALALAAAALSDDAAIAPGTEAMRAGGPAFGRTADALDALAARDAEAYRAALRAIVGDFESRDAYLTGVAIADTALVLECLAEPRGLAARPDSRFVPATD